MSEEVKETKAAEKAVEATEQESGPQELKLDGIYAFKVGMSSVYNDKGEAVPVTVLKYEPWKVSQVKSKKSDGYSAVQIACRPKKALRTSNAQKSHLTKAGFENGAYFIKEVRQSLPEGVEVGQTVSINSLQPGDMIQVSAKSKGRGFSGVVKRHGFAGGPATHGSGFHRRPGSIGNCEFPGRVMAGRKMPGQYGNTTSTVKNLQVVEVNTEESVILVKGPIPGAKNNLVKMVKA